MPLANPRTQAMHMPIQSTGTDCPQQHRHDLACQTTYMHHLAGPTCRGSCTGCCSDSGAPGYCGAAARKEGRAGSRLGEGRGDSHATPPCRANEGDGREACGTTPDNASVCAACRLHIQLCRQRRRTVCVHLAYAPSEIVCHWICRTQAERLRAPPHGSGCRVPQDAGNRSAQRQHTVIDVSPMLFHVDTLLHWLPQ